ncbi:MAG TPA: TolC family protein [Polyangia bacterium]|nr:TolC family protein [Polyangia bacterium]
MKRLAAILAFSASAWTTQARAQHAEPPTPPAPSLADAPAATIERSGLPELSFEEAMAMARKNNRAIKVDRAQLAVAQTATDTAWSALLPTIAAQGKYTRNYAQVQLGFPIPVLDAMGHPVLDPTTGTPETMVKKLLLQPSNQWDGVISATTPLVAPAAWAALKAVNASVDSAEANFQAQEAQLLVQAAEAFLAAAGTDELVEARRSSLIVARATLKDAETRLAAGSVTKVDVDRAQLAVVRAEQQEREALTARDRGYRGLATLLQMSKPFKVNTSFPTAPMPDSNDVGTALHLRPEFRALEQTVRSAEQDSEARAWLWAPTLSAFGNARKFNYDNFHFDRYSWAVGAQLDWLLFDGGARDAARHQANARAAAAREQAAVFADNVRDDLANSSGDLRTKQQGVEAAQRAVALANESLDLIRTQYSAGTATQLDLLQAQDAVIGANIALVQAHFDVASADLALRYAAGTFPPK